MRTSVGIAALLGAYLGLAQACAFASDTKGPDEHSIAALVAKAEQAEPRDQCYLYAQLVHQMTELSLRQYAAGNVAKADGLLKRIQAFTTRIHMTLARNDKRLKNAQILLSKTAFRLTQMLHSSDYYRRPLLAQTLAKVNDAQEAAMMEVFQR